MANATLEDFEDKAEAPPPTRPGGKSDLENLADGKYRFAINSMGQKTTKDGRLIITIAVEICDGGNAGQRFDHTYWLNKKDGERDDMAFDRLRRDLVTLGFDVPNWKNSNGRPFAKEFEKACGVIVGVEFHGAKVSNKSEDKKTTYHNLYINKRGETDGKPETFGPEQLKAAEQPFGVED